jgi:hypothetical protein
LIGKITSKMNMSAKRNRQNSFVETDAKSYVTELNNAVADVIKYMPLRSTGN